MAATAAGTGTAPLRRQRHRPCGAHGSSSWYSTSRGAVIGVEMVDGLHLDHADLLALDEGRHRDDDGEFLRLAFVVARHGDGGGVAVARQHHLGGLVEQLRNPPWRRRSRRTRRRVRRARRTAPRWRRSRRRNAGALSFLTRDLRIIAGLLAWPAGPGEPLRRQNFVDEQDERGERDQRDVERRPHLHEERHVVRERARPRPRR